MRDARRVEARHGPRAPGRAARGVALIAVLWIVAALSLLVAGMSQSVRQQLRTASAGRDALQAQATADAAIHLVLQALQASRGRITALERRDVEFGGVAVSIAIQPLDGLIDLNSAPAALLSALLRVAGGLAPGDADALAEAIVAWRGSRPGSPTPWRFEAAEDLLLVPGLNYPLFERIRPMVTAEATGNGRVAALAANADVLNVLAGGNAALADQIAAARASGQAGIDLTRLPQNSAGSSASTRYRIAASVTLDQGKIAGFERIVVAQETAEGYPWRTLRAQPFTDAVGH